MFRPIKNLIIYLQKNATNNPIFGGSNDNNISTAGAAEQDKEMEVNTRATAVAALAITKPATRNLTAQNDDILKDSPKKVNSKESPKKLEPKKIINNNKNSSPVKAPTTTPTKALNPASGSSQQAAVIPSRQSAAATATGLQPPATTTTRSPTASPIRQPAAASAAATIPTRQSEAGTSGKSQKSPTTPTRMSAAATTTNLPETKSIRVPAAAATATPILLPEAATTQPPPPIITLDDDDIEAQIESSIMLRCGTTPTINKQILKNSKILNIKKSSPKKSPTDFNRNHTLPAEAASSTPPPPPPTILNDDVLEDFCDEPIESIQNKTRLQNNCSVLAEEVISDDEFHEPVVELWDGQIIPIDVDNEDITPSKTDDRNVITPIEVDVEDVLPIEDVVPIEVEDEDVVPIEVEDEDVVPIEEDEEEAEGIVHPPIDLDNFSDGEVIVLDGGDINTSINLDSSTTDDPLAIACEEQEAFAADKQSALKELNLLNTSDQSLLQDDASTTQDDMQWFSADTAAEQGATTTSTKTTTTTTNINQSVRPSTSSSSSTSSSLRCNNDGKQNQKDNPIIILTEDDAPEKEERNGEGSDSGLGSETSALHITATSITDTSQCAAASSPNKTPQQLKTTANEKTLSAIKNSTTASTTASVFIDLSKLPPKDPPKPLRSNLKRRLEVDDDDVDALGNLTSNNSTSATSTSSASTDHANTGGSIQKKPKRSINFDTVQVYYFPRQQGFSCVPSAGGCTLGMGARHVAFKTLTLAEHAAELRRAHRQQLQDINPRGSSSDDSEESEEDYLSEGSGSDLDGESNGFLQPVSPKQRRSLLKVAGIRKIDTSEKADCRNIRNSREVCGCSCREFCDPETCSCSQSGIKCQVDRDMFPCGCSRDACGNTVGRVEFNPARVRTHFIHTLMRLEMENRQQQNPYSTPPAIASATVSSSNSPLVYYHSTNPHHSMHQSQSNYSSGYASPAYNAPDGVTASTNLHHQQSAYYGASQQQPYDQQSVLETTATSSIPYGIDSLDGALFGGSVTATPSYGELLPFAGFHNGNMQTQATSYNSYHNATPYMNATGGTSSNINTPLNTPPSTYSSCAVPSIPPYGTATTTEATGDYHHHHHHPHQHHHASHHNVTSLTTLETATTVSANNGTDNNNKNNTTTLDSEDDRSSFISLSTPLASSSRLSQINDLLQHNRNATTALVAVSQSIGDHAQSSSSKSNNNNNSINSQANNNSAFSSTPSINTPPIEDAQKSCMSAYDEYRAPLNPAPIVVTMVEKKKPELRQKEKPKATMPALSSKQQQSENINENESSKTTATTTTTTQAAATTQTAAAATTTQTTAAAALNTANVFNSKMETLNLSKDDCDDANDNNNKITKSTSSPTKRVAAAAAAAAASSSKVAAAAANVIKVAIN